MALLICSHAGRHPRVCRNCDHSTPHPPVVGLGGITCEMAVPCRMGAGGRKLEKRVRCRRRRDAKSR